MREFETYPHIKHRTMCGAQMKVLHGCRYETQLVEEVVRKVLLHLGRQPLELPNHLVGMDTRIQDALDHLQSDAAGGSVKVTLLRIRIGYKERGGTKHFRRSR